MLFVDYLGFSFLSIVHSVVCMQFPLLSPLSCRFSPEPADCCAAAARLVGFYWADANSVVIEELGLVESATVWLHAPPWHSSGFQDILSRIC